MVPETWDLVRFEVRGLAPHDAVRESTGVHATVCVVGLLGSYCSRSCDHPPVGWEGDSAEPMLVFLRQIGADMVKVMVASIATVVK